MAIQYVEDPIIKGSKSELSVEQTIGKQLQ